MDPASDGSSSSFTEFTLAEIIDMEKLYKDYGDQSLRKDFCQTVACSFSCSVNRKGKSSVTGKQVERWFQGKLKKQNQGKSKAKPSPPEILDLSHLSAARNAGNATSVEKRNLFLSHLSAARNAGKASDLMDLAFEGKSEKDGAWYDVASFQSYRTLSTGEKEARVRFSGFDNEHDEWLNIKKSLRQRSIPVESSECGRVKVGDLLVCFQEREDQKVYRDAHVLDIKREVHDGKKCSCVFIVRFDNDNTEESLGIDKIWRRPAK